MRQFDVVVNANPETHAQVPYLLVLQSDLLSGLDTRVVAPLIRQEHFGTTMDRLNPFISVDGESFVLSITELAGISVAALGGKIQSAECQRTEIIGAMDFLITGG